MKRFSHFVLALALVSTTPAVALAGPCTDGISKLQVAFDQRLDKAAANGPSGTETTDAKMHHQPTQESVAEAEEQLGELSPDTAERFTQAMQRARDADEAHNEAQCLSALHDARAILKP